MFDIGFSEIVLIAVVALLVVGPKEFPTLVRKAGEWVGAVRRAVHSVKSEFEKEVQKADEIKRLMEREIEIAEAHMNTPPVHRAVLTPPASREAAAPEKNAADGAPSASNDAKPSEVKTNEAVSIPVAPTVPVAITGKQAHATPQAK